MCKFAHLVQIATSRIIQQYFEVETAGETLVWRERVYCYELYHQLRKLLHDNCRLTLAGELDKGGHPEFEERMTPDFIFHIQKTNECNEAVMEVKSQDASEDGIYKDLEKLKKFKCKYGYRHAIYLFFGREFPCDKLKTVLENSEFKDLPKIIILHHRTVEEPAVRVHFKLT